MESIALVRKDESGREQRSAKTIAEARGVLDEWEQNPAIVTETGKQGGTRSAPKRKSAKTSGKRKH